ncbi:MAG: NAD-dependent deacylase [Actinomycetota bacterium]|nr:NAD-dependent deacylase [Actinomycetota bacterium]
MGTKNQIAQATKLIREANETVVFSGAGISTSSGIPAFRGQGGLWDEYSPALFANIPGLLFTFLTNKRRIFSFTRDVLSALVEAEPNAAHIAVSDLQKMGKVSAVITQNIDNLHQKAGSSKVIELHGNIFRLRCLRCGRKKTISPERMREAVEKLKKEEPKRSTMFSMLRRFLGRCDCGGVNRPDVVFFGESLPKEALGDALRYAHNVDCMIAIGTSGVVYPAASIPLNASSTGAKIIEINPTPTNFTPLAKIYLQKAAEEALPSIAEALRTSEA